MTPDEDDIPISDEEKKVAVYLIVAVVLGVLAATAAVALVIGALPDPGEPLDSGRLAVALAVAAAIFAAILFAIFGRWPGSVASEATVDIAAGPYEVWDAVALRPDYPGWKRIYTGVERLDEEGEVYRLYYAEDSHCPRCKLPRDPDRSRWSSRVEVLEARRPSFYRQRSFPKARSPGPLDDFLECEETAMLLQPLEGGGTRVTFGSIAVRPRMWMAFLSWLGRPAREHLSSLKAHVEGTPDDSLFGVSARRMAAARAARQRCSCAASA